MVETKTITYSALGGIGVVLLTLFGANLFDGTHYYCSEKNISMQCDRFSSTGLRCYPQPIITTGYKDCPSTWSLIINDVKETPKTSNNVLSYTCTPKGCDV